MPQNAWHIYARREWKHRRVKEIPSKIETNILYTPWFSNKKFFCLFYQKHVFAIRVTAPWKYPFNFTKLLRLFLSKVFKFLRRYITLSQFNLDKSEEKKKKTLLSSSLSQRRRAFITPISITSRLFCYKIPEGIVEKKKDEDVPRHWFFDPTRIRNEGKLSG